jgi:hypothetical protein
MNEWTELEIEALTELYPTQGTKIPELERTPYAVQHKARKLGLKYEARGTENPDVSRHGEPWEDWELILLEDGYPYYGTRIPGLKRTRYAVQTRAHRMGLCYEIKYPRYFSLWSRRKHEWS